MGMNSVRSLFLIGMRKEELLKGQWTDIILAGPLDVRNATHSSKVHRHTVARYKSLGVIKIHSPGHGISSSMHYRLNDTFLCLDTCH